MSDRFEHFRIGGGRRLPVLLQTEVAECGLACLAMVASFHGHDIDLPSLRRRFSTSSQGASLARLIDIARQLGFETRPLRLDLRDLAQLSSPCLLHWDLNHFVVLKRVTARGVEIHDPARGACRFTLDEAGRHFTGIALEVSPSADFAPVTARQHVTIRALTGRVSGLKRAAFQVLLLALALEMFALALPFCMQWVLDQVLVTADLDLLTLIGIGFLLVVAFQAATTAARGWAVSGIGATLNAQWVTNLFSHLLRLPLDYFEKRHVAEVLSRFASVHAVQQTLTGSFVEALLDGLTASLILVALLLYSPALTALVLAAFAIYAVLRGYGYQRLAQVKEEQLIYVARQQTQLLESIRGVQAIKLANKQGDRQSRLSNATVQVANREAALQRIASTFTALGLFVFGAQRVLLIWIAGALVLQGRFSAGMLVGFVAYADLFATRMCRLVDKCVELRLLRLHGQRIADIALEPPEPDTRSDYRGPPPEASIEIDGLSFRYSDGEPWILRNCSFRIGAQESVAISGPSGCGKTTLAKLLLGLLEPTEGIIRVGGIDIRRYGLEAYRALFGAVMQEDELFSGSIADNIAFFDAAATPHAIEAAAERACVHEDIAAMPMGYETLVGDMGSSLSGGQKQRVLLARALYRTPAILLFDEATSHLDVARERAINAEVSRLKTTRIIIAHRPDTIASADRVLTLRNGTIEETVRREIASAVVCELAAR